MMHLAIVVADATRARLFTFEQLETDAEEPAQDFREHASLVNTGRRKRPSEHFSDTRPGSDRTPTGRGFAHDDHREASLRHMDRQFATDIVDELRRLLRAGGYREVILAASPRMLANLRELTADLVRTGVVFRELDRDLVKLTRAQLHDHLCERGMLPERERVGASSVDRTAG